MSIGNARKTKSGALEFLDQHTGGPLTLGSLVESIRLGEDLSQPQFARLIGLSRSHLNDIEKGRKAVSPGRASRFAKVLGYSEKQFVRLALQAILDRDGVGLRVDVA